MKFKRINTNFLFLTTIASSDCVEQVEQVEKEWKVLGPYDYVSFPKDIGGKLAFSVEKDSKRFIVYDGKEIGKEYDYAGHIWECRW